MRAQAVFFSRAELVHYASKTSTKIAARLVCQRVCVAWLSESRFKMLSTYFYDNLNGTPAPRKPIRLMSDPNFDAIHLIRSPAFKPHHAHAHMCSRCADVSREFCPCARVCGGGGVFDDQSIEPNVCHFGTQPLRRVCAAAPLGFVEFPDWNGIMMAIGAL